MNSNVKEMQFVLSHFLFHHFQLHFSFPMKQGLLTREIIPISDWFNQLNWVDFTWEWGKGLRCFFCLFFVLSTIWKERRKKPTDKNIFKCQETKNRKEQNRTDSILFYFVLIASIVFQCSSFSIFMLFITFWKIKIEHHLHFPNLQTVFLENLFHWFFLPL